MEKISFLVDKVAKRIAENYGISWDNISTDHKNEFRQTARSAICEIVDSFEGESLESVLFVMDREWFTWNEANSVMEIFKEMVSIKNEK